MCIARDGLNVVLTIDAVVRHIVETALADALQKASRRASITGIVMRPQTGRNSGDGVAAELRPGNQPSTITPETRNRALSRRRRNPARPSKSSSCPAR
jgi:hypothetical protein